MSKNALLLYPNQLFAIDHLPNDIDEIVLVEEPMIFGTDQQHQMYMHKQKLVFLRATMRRYMEEELWPAGFKVDYIEFSHLNETEDIVEKLKDFDRVFIFDINDDIITRRLLSSINAHPEGPEVDMMKSPGFMLSLEDVLGFFNEGGKTSFKDFYQWQRERFNILISPSTYKPLEGKWLQESKTRKLAKNMHPPGFQTYGDNDYIEEARKYVNKHFTENPGSTTDFPWPTSREEAHAWLDEFLENRIERYAEFHDAIEESVPWMYHSAISPMINCGLLTPYEVIDRTLTAAENNNYSPKTIEPFIRNVAGWREYIRALYRKHNSKLRSANKYDHQRRMTHDWYSGTTGLLPVDHALNKVKARAYTHQSERTMVLGNIMFACEFHPDDVYRWFMEMFIDSYDWMVVPYVYGLNQDAAGLSDAFLGVSDSSYILSVSHYEKGEWSDVWDGLYYRTIDKHKAKFAKNPKLKKLVRELERLDNNKQRVVGYRAEDFLGSKTVAPENNKA